MERIRGKIVSAGIVSGKALLYSSQKEIVRLDKVSPENCEKEIWRFDNAVKKTQAQLKKIQQDLARVMGKDAAFIIETQSLLLQDSNLLNEINGLIKNSLLKAEWAIQEVEKKYRQLFDSIPDLSFKQKSSDISDVLNRIINNLRKSRRRELTENVSDAILVAEDLSPSETAKLMSRKKLLGLVLDKGGDTSHTVILARTLGIPAIFDTGNASRVINNDDQVVIDGLAGEVIVNPSPAMVAELTVKKEKFQLYQERLKAVAPLADVTRDRHPFTLMANIELPFEGDMIQAYGAKGIGLFRTEFLYLESGPRLSEEEQYLIYKDIAQKVFPHPLVIRTFDIGREKAEPGTTIRGEANPSLGLMAVRMFLANRQPLKRQIKAIQRANSSGNIRILFPMITEIEEIHSLRQIMAETSAELIRENRQPKHPVQVGIMIEIPAAIGIIPHLGETVDFFSVGSNDLMQYLLAADRNNSAVSYLLSPFHPAVVRTLLEIRQAADHIRKPVTVCGEMAGKCVPALMLLGLGYRHFSMNPLAIPEIKRIFTRVHYSWLKRIVNRLLDFSSRTEIEEYLIESLLKKYPSLFLHQQML